MIGDVSGEKGCDIPVGELCGSRRGFAAVVGRGIGVLLDVLLGERRAEDGPGRDFLRGFHCRIRLRPVARWMSNGEGWWCRGCDDSNGHAMDNRDQPEHCLES